MAQLLGLVVRRLCMLPCVDEPARKAVFKVTMQIPRGLLALGNMPEKSRTVLTGADDGLVSGFIEKLR